MDRKKALSILNILYDTNDKKIIRKKYHEACLKYHPDKNKNMSDKMIEINEAYKYLNENIEIEDKTSPFFYFKDEYIYSSYLIFKEIFEPLKEHVRNYKRFTLNTTLERVLNKELYFLKDYDLYIPLWHNELLYEKLNIKVQIDINLPNHIIIDDENNITFYLDLKNKKKDELIVFTYGNLDLSFIYNDEKRKIFKNIGIPKINPYNIYDFSILSDVILLI